MSVNNSVEAERLLIAAYLSLDGSSEATVYRCGTFVIKLREIKEPTGMPLWLELVEELPLDGAGFQEVVDGVPHLISFLRAAQNGPETT